MLTLNSYHASNKESSSQTKTSPSGSRKAALKRNKTQFFRKDLNTLCKLVTWEENLFE